jgi:hypothetical protein
MVGWTTVLLWNFRFKSKVYLLKNWKNPKPLPENRFIISFHWLLSFTGVEHVFGQENLLRHDPYLLRQ